MKFTIVVRTCNRPDFLKEALASIQLQTHTDWEVLIFDDGATDINFKIFKLFKYINKDKRILYITSDSAYDMFRNSWIYAPDLAKGEVMVRLDDDDILASDCLEFLNNVYAKNKELDFSYGSAVFFKDSTLENIINTKNPFEHPRTKDAWAPYVVPNNHPWKEPWTFLQNYYSEPQPFTSIIHAAKANAFCIYHTYVLRTNSVKNIKDKISVTSKFVDDLEFLGSLDNLGLGFNSIKKILCYVRVHDSGRVTDKNLIVDNTNIWDENFRIRDKVDELRSSGHLSKIIPIQVDGNFNNGIDDTLNTAFTKTIADIKEFVENHFIYN